MAAEKKVVDWVAIEADFRAGIKPLRQIAEENGITHGAVNKRAKRDGWSRDLKAKIRAQADAKVSKAAVSKEVSAKKVVTEQAVVDANAEVQFRVRMEHRKDIGRTRSVFQKLMGELEETTDNKELFSRLGELLDESGEDANGRMVKDRLNEIYHKVISMPGRVDSAKKLTEILEKVIKLEREAFGIDDGDKGLGEVDSILKKINSEAA